MTRLTTADLRNLDGTMAAYEHYLRDTTGRDLAGLALDAAGLPVNEVHRGGLAALQMAVVPISSGLGLIGGFAQSVAAILAYLGCRSFVTQATDVAGMAEAVARGPAAIFMSDDRDFFALDPAHRTTVHNTPATARGFAAGLAGMADGLEEKKVLLLGCGPVGRAAAEALLRRGAHLIIGDRNRKRQAALIEALRSGGRPQTCIDPMEVAHANTADLIFDATNTGDHIDVEMIGDTSLVAAPGMPCGVTAAARRVLGNRLLHDPLQIGVATMAAQLYAASLKRVDAKRQENGRGETRG